MDKHKLILPVSILLGCIILGGFYYTSQISKQNSIQIQTNNLLQKQQEDLFNKNQDCFKYKEVLEKKLLNKESPFGETSLEQIFYSPKQNSCLYVEYSVESFGGKLSGEYCYNRRLLDILNDGESSEPLEACLTVCPHLQTEEVYIQRDCKNFDKMLEQYKN